MCFIIYKCFINKIKNIIKMVQGQGQGNAGPKEAGGIISDNNCC